VHHNVAAVSRAKNEEVRRRIPGREEVVGDFANRPLCSFVESDVHLPEYVHPELEVLAPRVIFASDEINGGQTVRWK